MMPQGTVKWFSESKGYGFIAPEGNDKHAKDIFVHWSGIIGDGYKKLVEGDQVEFEIFDGTKGKQAGNVKIILDGERAAGA